MREAPPVISYDQPPLPTAHLPAVRFMTLNVAHGRSDGFHQLFQPDGRLIDNLDAIAELMRSERIDVVGLQEADGIASWSGSFDHVEYMAQRAGMGYSLHGIHVDIWQLAYGTAIASRYRLGDPLSVTFRAGSVGQKGFVVASMDWPNAPGVEVDVVSLHLDALSQRMRLRQLGEMSRLLLKRNRPRIIMGDFNLSLRRSHVARRMMVDDLGMRGERLEERVWASYPRLGRRLDYVLASAEFRFLSYRTLNVSLSDHLPIVADIALRDDTPPTSP